MERICGWNNYRRLISEMTIGRNGGKGLFRWCSNHGRRAENAWCLNIGTNPKEVRNILFTLVLK